MRDGSLTHFGDLKVSRVVPIGFDAAIRTRLGSGSFTYGSFPKSITAPPANRQKLPETQLPRGR